MKSKVQIAAIVLLMIITLAFPLRGQESTNVKQQELQPIVVAEMRAEFWIPVYLAYQLGYFREEGLDVKFVTYKDGPIAFQGMHSGDSQFCLLSSEPVLRAYDRGKKSVIILSTMKNKPYMLVAGKGINNVRDLKGKVVFAGGPGSAPYSFVSTVLASEGLDPKSDVTWANMEYGSALAALEKGHIAASFIRAATVNKLSKIGGTVLVDVTDPVQHKAVYGSERYESSIVTVTREYAEKNPETVQKFANAVFKAIRWQNKHGDKEVADMAAPLFSGDQVNAEAVGILRSSFSPDGDITEAGYATIERFCMKEGTISKPAPFREVIDTSFIRKAKETLRE